MRLFIAIAIPKEIRLLLHHLGRGIQGSRAVPEDMIHITLRFIGEVDECRFHTIADILHDVRIAPFSLAIKGTGYFPPRGNPRVIWAGIDNAEYLHRLQKRIDQVLLRCGIPPEGGKFSPHITLARCKTTSAERAARFLTGNALLHSDDFAVDAFHLFSSTLTPQGALHTIERSYPLIAGPR